MDCKPFNVFGSLMPREKESHREGQLGRERASLDADKQYCCLTVMYGCVHHTDTTTEPRHSLTRRVSGGDNGHIICMYTHQAIKHCSGLCLCVSWLQSSDETNNNYLTENIIICYIMHCSIKSYLCSTHSHISLSFLHNY